MKKMKLNQSGYGIWMNEKAFPNEAINTIGFLMHFPEHGAERVADALNHVIDRIALWNIKLNIEGETPFLEKEESNEKCEIGGELSKKEAEVLWTEKSQKSMSDRTLKAEVYSITEGGSSLFVLFHHVLMDGYSMCRIAQAVLDELQDISIDNMESFVTSDAGEADKASDNEPEKKFWMEYFEGVNSEPAIFSGKTNGYKRNCYHYKLGMELTGQIKEYAKQRNLTETSVFSAAFCLYLARAMQTRDAVYLMPRLNRNTQQQRKEIGCFTLVVPVRVTVDDKLSFEELCSHALSQGQLASVHKTYGMDNIINDLHNSGLITGSISEYTLNFYSTRLHTDIPYEICMSMDGAMHNHLTLNITAFDGEFEILYDARDGIYTGEMVQRFHESLVSIIQSGIDEANAAKPVGNYEIVGIKEQDVLFHMMGKNVPVSDTATIPSMFRDAVAAYSERPALYAADKQYTYAELDALSNRIAHALLAYGCTMGQTVMYKLKRDYRLIPAMLGILKAGDAFIPIDPEYPKGRIDYIQKNSGASLMIVNHESMDESCKEENVRILDVDELLEYADETDPLLSIPQEQLAYCIYTSGTTGNPKGVQLSHRGIVNIANADNNPFNRDIAVCGTGIVAIGSVCFDISLFEFFVPLLNGMFIEFAPERAMADPAAIAELLQKHGANMLHCTPSRLAAYLHNKKFTEALQHVEVILAAGEALPGTLVQMLRDSYGIRIYNGYGPTETTIGATITEAGDNQTIGKPIANMGVMILDKEGRLIPYGAVGEICVYGKGLGLGYRNLLEETKKRFVQFYGKKVYRTGDLGCFMADGRIEYHGRNDFQVKIRGLRIELSEIENCMLSYTGIGSACVQVRRIAGNEHLAGFYTVKNNYAVDADALKVHLKAHLTLYMVPDILKELEKMPQTPGGKTDLRALSEIPVEYVRIYRKPENDFQKAICKSFEKVLGQEQVGLDDNFFEIGGDSLHTAELVSEIEERLPEVEVSFEDIFRYPIPELLAQFLYRQITETSKEKQNPLENLNYDGIIELLAKNEVSDDIEQHHLGNILLTGVTGFLGIHILMELIRCTDCWDRIYCLVRPTKRLDSEKRLKNILYYFDETDCGELFGNCIFALNGDITNINIFSNDFDEHIDTVINCAANVSHFAYDDKLEKVNTVGVHNLISYCERENASLVQISTISVGGVYESGGNELTLSEKDLYIGQEIRNQYIFSKYMAEYEILCAAVKKGIPVKIMRVGNLQGRISDGEFQMNRKTNAFTRKISSYVKIGKVPESLYRASVNFSPVDEVARMIVALSRMTKRYSVFHVYPEAEASFEKLFGSLSLLGHSVSVLPDEEFEKEVKKLGSTKEGRILLEGILVERSDFRFQDTIVTETFTQEILHKLGIKWKPITEEYLKRYFKTLEEFHMFDMED